MDKVLTFINFVFTKLQEPGTQKGIALILGLVGYHIDPTLLPQIIAAYTAVHAIIEIAKKG